MNDSALKYRAYKALLEADITDEQRQKLIEANIFQKIADFFGAGKDTLTTDLKKIFQNNKLNKRAATAKKNIEKEIAELKDIAKEAGVSEEAVYDMLNLTLKGSSVSPEEVASPPKASRSSEPDESSSGIPAGKPVDTKSPAAVSTLASAAASVAGKDPEKAKEDAVEKKVDVQKASEVLSKAVSSVSKVDAGKVLKIVNYLIKNNHMLAEGRRRVMSVDIKKAISEIEKRHSDLMVLERWNSISGIRGLLAEAADEAKKKKFEDVIYDIRKAFDPKELSDDDILNVIIALDDLDSIQIK